jgi:hypothetical protein
MKVYTQGANVIIDTEDPQKEIQYIPIQNSKVVFIGNTVKIYDYTDENETSFSSVVTDLKDQSGSLIGNKSDVSDYLTDFIGAVGQGVFNNIKHIELTNPSGVVYSDYNELSFVCDGSINVLIDGITVQFPKTMGGTVVLGETLKADTKSKNTVTFTGTGTVLITLKI